MRTLTARWVFPVTGAPIEDGAVAIEGGRIFRVGLPPEACRRYLRHRLCFDLGPRHLCGLQTFLEMLTESEALPRLPALSFVSL